MDKMGKEKTEDEEMEDFRDGGKSQDIDEMDEIENTSCNCLKIMVMLTAIITLVCIDTIHFWFYGFVCFMYSIY